jgi:predicted RNA-binding protein YlqC (UPF0109 family)
MSVVGDCSSHFVNATLFFYENRGILALTLLGIIESSNVVSLLLLTSFGMADVQHDQAFLEYVVKAIVNKPELVSVDRLVDDRGVLLTLHVDPSDMKYVIGKRGQMAQALRILLKGVGPKTNARINMKIYEPEEARRAHQEGRAPHEEAAPAEQRYGESGLVTDDDLADLGI